MTTATTDTDLSELSDTQLQRLIERLHGQGADLHGESDAALRAITSLQGQLAVPSPDSGRLAVSLESETRRLRVVERKQAALDERIVDAKAELARRHAKPVECISRDDWERAHQLLRQQRDAGKVLEETAAACGRAIAGVLQSLAQASTIMRSECDAELLAEIELSAGPVVSAAILRVLSASGVPVKRLASSLQDLVRASYPHEPPDAVLKAFTDRLLRKLEPMDAQQKRLPDGRFPKGICPNPLGKGARKAHLSTVRSQQP